MRTLFRVLAALALFTAVAWLLLPVVREGLRFARLLSESPPTRLPMPVASSAKVTNSWGIARAGGRLHEGIDIFAPRSTPVLSTTRGIVIRTGTNRLGGLVVSVLGPGGYTHYYAHLSGIAEGVTERVWVEPGQVLGYVGNSGNARGGPTHLHYGIYAPRGGATNPYPLLTARAATPPGPGQAPETRDTE